MSTVRCEQLQQPFYVFFCFALQSDVESKCSDILKLGLLHTDMSPRKAKTGTRTQPEWLSFPSAMLQEVLIKWYKKAR